MRYIAILTLSVALAGLIWPPQDEREVVRAVTHSRGDSLRAQLLYEAALLRESLRVEVHSRVIFHVAQYAPSGHNERWAVSFFGRWYVL